MEENSARDRAQWEAAISKVSEVSGFAGRFLAHSTRKDRNLRAEATTIIIKKLVQKRSACFAKSFTFLD